jgi:hypothetical protein
VTLTGALNATASRIVSPTLTSVNSSFVFTLPATASALDAVTITVQATDAAGNLSAGVVQRQRVKDIIAPQVVATTHGVTTVLPLGRVAVTVTGTDDIAIAQLGVNVAGAFTTTLGHATTITKSAAGIFHLQFPADVRPGSLVYLTGRAGDSSGNLGYAAPLTLTVGRPRGALTGAVTWFGSDAPVAGAIVRIVAGNGVFTVTADANGLYQTLEPVVGNTQVTAFDPVSGARGVGSRNIPPDDLTPVIDVVISAHPTVTVTDPLSGSQVIHNSTITTTVEAWDDRGLNWVDFYVDGVLSSSQWGGSGGSFRFTHVVPGDAVSLTLHAVAHDVDGNRTASAPVLVRAVADPLTTVTGRVVNAAGQPVAGAAVTTNGGRTATSAPDGRFTITGVTTIQGNISALARLPQEGLVLSGRSIYTAAVRGGVTPVGDIALGLRKVWDGGAGNDNWNVAANWNDDRVPAADDDVYIPVTATVSIYGYYNTIHSLRSDGRLTLASGDLTLLGDAIVRSNLTLASGRLASSAGITVTGLFSWTNGTLAGPGRVVALGGLALQGTDRFLEGAALVNRGAGAWESGNQHLTEGAVLENAAGATLTISANATLAHYYNAGAAPRFENRGVLTKTGTSTLQLLTAFDNAGRVAVEAGELLLNGALNHTGAFAVASGATLRLNNSATGVMATGSTVTGAGTVILNTSTGSGRSLTLAGAYALSGETQQLSGATVISPTATFSTGRLWLSNGRLEPQTAITVTGVLTWSSATLAGPGSTYVAQRIVLDGGNRLLDGHTLRNGGQATWLGTIRGANGAVWHNLPGATLDIPGDVNTNWWERGPQPAVRNEGALRKVAPATTADLNGVITNTGVIDIISGTLTLPAASSTSGVLRVSQGATLTLSAATHQVLAGGVISNSGQLILASGVLSVTGRYDAPGVTQANSGVFAVAAGAPATNLGSPLRLQGATLNLAPGAEAAAHSLLLANGAVQGSGAITVSEGFTWTGGSLLGDGVLNLAGRGLIGPGSLELNGRRLAITGATEWLGGSLRGSNGAVLHVHPSGALSVTNNATLDSLSSQGARTLLHVEGRLAVSVPVAANSGFDVRGDLRLDGAATLASGAMVIHANGVQRGALTVQPGAVLEVRSRYTTEVGSTITGLGTVRQNGGATALAGDYAFAGLTEVRNGTVTPANGSVFAPANLTLHAPGVVSATGDITVTQVFTWGGGALRGDGVTYVAGSANLVAGEPGYDWNKYLLRRSLVVASQGVWNAGNVRANDGASLRILPGASFDVQAGGTLEHFNNTGARPTLLVEGELVKSAGAETFVDFIVNNLGEVRAGAGVFTFRQGGANQSVFTADAGGVLKFTANFSHTAPSTVQGLGAVQVNGGALDVAGAYAVGGATVVETAGGLNLLPGSDPLSLGRVELRRGGLMLRTGQSVAIPVLVVGQTNPTLTTDNPLQVTEVMTWTDGTLQGAGDLLVYVGRARLVRRRHEAAQRLPPAQRRQRRLAAGCDLCLQRQPHHQPGRRRLRPAHQRQLDLLRRRRAGAGQPGHDRAFGAQRRPEHELAGGKQRRDRGAHRHPSVAEQQHDHGCAAHRRRRCAGTVDGRASHRPRRQRDRRWPAARQHPGAGRRRLQHHRDDGNGEQRGAHHAGAYGDAHRAGRPGGAQRRRTAAQQRRGRDHPATAHGRRRRAQRQRHGDRDRRLHLELWHAARRGRNPHRGRCHLRQHDQAERWAAAAAGRRNAVDGRRPLPEQRRNAAQLADRHVHDDDGQRAQLLQPDAADDPQRRRDGQGGRCGAEESLRPVDKPGHGAPAQRCGLADQQLHADRRRDGAGGRQCAQQQCAAAARRRPARARGDPGQPDQCGHSDHRAAGFALAGDGQLRPGGRGRAGRGAAKRRPDDRL